MLRTLWISFENLANYIYVWFFFSTYLTTFNELSKIVYSGSLSLLLEKSRTFKGHSTRVNSMYEFFHVWKINAGLFFVPGCYGHVNADKKCRYFLNETNYDFTFCFNIFLFFFKRQQKKRKRFETSSSPVYVFYSVENEKKREKIFSKTNHMKKIKWRKKNRKLGETGFNSNNLALTVTRANKKSKPTAADKQEQTIITYFTMLKVTTPKRRTHFGGKFNKNEKKKKNRLPF